jgi:hypothetical protein
MEQVVQPAFSRLAVVGFIVLAAMVLPDTPLLGEGAGRVEGGNLL